jgi:hypothetical protein
MSAHETWYRLQTQAVLTMFHLRNTRTYSNSFKFVQIRSVYQTNLNCDSIKAVPWFRRLGAGFPPRRPGLELRSGHVVFVVDKVALRQVFSEYYRFPCQFSFHRWLYTHHLSSEASTTGQFVADVPRGLSLTQPQET